MFKVTSKSVSSIIDKYIGLFGENMRPLDYIIVDKKCDISKDAPASLIGPIDGEYGLFINVKDYIFDSEELITSIILHELVHYKLLLDGKQSKDNIHDEAFQELAAKIEKTANISGVTYGMNYVHENIKYKNKTFYPIVITKDGKNVITRINMDKLPYWRKYLKECVEYGDFEGYKIVSPTNKKIFEVIPLTTATNMLDCIEYDENIFHLNL